MNFGVLLLLFLFLFSCSSNDWNVPPDYVGHWQSYKNKITVRTEPKFMKFQFASDSAFITININSERTAEGFIGWAEFKNGKVRKNSGDPQKTGVAYIIECGSIGKIFKNDRKEAKEVEIWLGPINEDRSIKAELRYTEGMAVFPMSGMVFFKAEIN